MRASFASVRRELFRGFDRNYGVTVTTAGTNDILRPPKASVQAVAAMLGYGPTVEVSFPPSAKR